MGTQAYPFRVWGFRAGVFNGERLTRFLSGTLLPFFILGPPH